MIGRYRTYVRIVVAAMLECGCRDLARSADRAVVFRSDTIAAAYFSVAELDSFSVPWYADAVRTMREPPMRDASIPPGTTVLRFVYLRAFHNGISVRVTFGPGQCWVTTTEAPVLLLEIVPVPGSDSLFSTIERRYPPVRRDSALVAWSTCRALHRDMIAAGVRTEPAAKTRGGIDGSEWILEMIDSTGYHIINRWSPDSGATPALFRAGLSLLEAGRALPVRALIY